MKIVVFGDSVAKGIITENGTIKSAPKSAVEWIEDKLGISIDNRSYYGQTIKRLMDKGIVERYIESVPENEKNRIAIISLGGNDSDYDWKEVEKNPLFAHPSKTTYEEFIQCYDQLIHQLRKHGFKVILCTLFPIISKRFYDHVISQIADPKAIMEFFGGDVETIGRHQEAFNLAVMKVAEENHCPILDGRTSFLRLRSYPELVCTDGIHPNEKGYQVLSEVLLGEISRNKELLDWMKPDVKITSVATNLNEKTSLNLN